MLSLQLCVRIKANLGNCLQPNFPTFIHSSFPAPTESSMITPTTQRTFRNVYWQGSVLIPDVMTSFLSYLKETEPLLCCRRGTSTAVSLLHYEDLPLREPASVSLLTSQLWMAGTEILAQPVLWWAGAQLQTKLEHTTARGFYQKLFRTFSLQR